MYKSSLHHIGIIVDDFVIMRKVFDRMGYEQIGEIVRDDIQRNLLMFLKNKNGGTDIELIKPLDRDSTVAKAKIGLHHLCFEVEGEIREFHDKLTADRYARFVMLNVKAPAFDERMTDFACVVGGLYVEFLHDEGEHKNEE